MRWMLVAAALAAPLAAGSAATLAATLAGGAAEAGEAVPPYKTIRAMQALEDRIAGGDALAQAARAKAIVRLGQSFAAMPAETWRDLRNARALVAYLFGGGDAVTLARAIQPEALHKDAATLYRGALAYAGGDDDGARGLLLPIEAKTLPSGLAGHLALVQATLVEPTDKAKALALLDLTRLLEPGTLVEEAALRKEMSVIGGSGDFDKLNLLERRYQAAFVRSIYVESFRQLVGALAAQAAQANAPAGNDRLTRLLAPLPREDRRRLYLAVARREAVAGHLVSAPFAAAEGGKLADKGTRDEARAQLYYGASALASDAYEKASEALAAAAPDRLEERDQTLRIAALDMAATMRAAASGAIMAPAGESALLTKGEESLSAAETRLRSVAK